MRLRICLVLGIGLLAAFLPSARCAWAQADDDPFGDAPADDAPADEMDLDDPNDAPQPPGAAQPAAPEAPLPEPTDPATRAILSADPKTPDELIRAIRALVDLDQAPYARPLLRKLQALNLDDAGYSRLVEKYGTALMFKLREHPQLQPEGEALGAAALEATNRRAQSPVRVSELIELLDDPSRQVRQRAIARLAEGGEHSAAALVVALGDPAREAAREGIQQALLALGDVGAGALRVALRADDAHLQALAAECLARRGQREAILDLLVPALAADAAPEAQAAAQQAVEELSGKLPSPQRAAAILYTQASPLLRAPATVDPLLAPVTYWRWDRTQPGPAFDSLPPEVAQMQRGLELATGAYRLAPDSLAVKRLFLVAVAEHEGFAANLTGVPNAAAQTAALLGPESRSVVEDLLAFALEENFEVAAGQACAALGRLKDEQSLLGNGSRPSNLVQAAQHPLRSVRLAAAEAAVTIGVRQPYAGSSFVLQSLTYFAGSLGRRTALVGHPRLSEGSRLAGLLAELGYEIEVADNATDFVAMAIANPDIELALADVSLAGATSGELLARLRRDCRTALLPVGLLGGTDSLREAELLAERHELTAALITPRDARGMQYQLELWLVPLGNAVRPAEERFAQSRRALELLALLADQEHAPYDLQQVAEPAATAVWIAEYSEPAVQVLQALGTPMAQRSLVDLASDPTLPIEQRQAALAGFRESLASFGPLLTTTEIEEQYARYNRSRTQPHESQLVLGTILDVLEARAAIEQAGSVGASDTENGSH